MTTTEAPSVYLHDGTSTARLGEFVGVASVDRSYEVHGGGSALITIEAGDPLLEHAAPALGNLVVVQGQDFTAPWVGWVSQRTGKTSPGAASQVTLRCTSYGDILSHRVLGGDAAYTGAANRVFRAILADANAANPTGIRVGSVSASRVFLDSDAPLSVAHSAASDALGELAAIAGWEWWIDWTVSAARIEFHAHFAQARGRDAFGKVSLVEGGPVTVPEWSEGLEDVSRTVVVVGGAQHAAQSLADLAAAREDADFSPLPGPHGYAPEVGLSTQTPANSAEEVLLAEALKSQLLVEEFAATVAGRRRSTPARRVGLRVEDASRWADLRVGDVIHLDAPSAFLSGFNGPARIQAIEAREHAGYLELVVGLLRRKTQPEAVGSGAFA